MESKWFSLKPQAIELRQKGFSIKKIETRLGIPRSTLSGWLRGIELTMAQKKRLLKDWKEALVKARRSAVHWHNQQKSLRLRQAEKEAVEGLETIDYSDKAILDLALAMLYLGEGFKTPTTAIGNTNPLILKFFITVLIQNYDIDRQKIKCELHLRADQNSEKMKEFWSKELKIPISNFTKSAVDERTRGSKTYLAYKGVCVVRCGTVAIQRKLLYLSQKFCEKIISSARG